MKQAKPIIVGCSGPRLTVEEAELFAAERPAGLILFGRNCVDPSQLRSLVNAFREVVDDPCALVLVDQEGGRVARLKPPHWHAMPPAAVFGRMAKADFVEAAAALQLASAITAAELLQAGISVNCAPVLDLPVDGADPVIGDRGFAQDPGLVSRLGRVAADALLDSGVLPVIKHIPGHGRAPVDSHKTLPRVDADLETLCNSDILPFRAVADAPFAMTAHVVYEALDGTRPATHSRTVIEELVRGVIGFEGVLLSDDIAMEALNGSGPERASKALDAGCDLVLHCTGVIGETREVLEATARMSTDTLEALETARSTAGEADKFDVVEAYRRLEGLLAAWV